jgi:hypothetical protein
MRKPEYQRSLGAGVNHLIPVHTANKERQICMNLTSALTLVTLDMSDVSPFVDALPMSTAGLSGQDVLERHKRPRDNTWSATAMLIHTKKKYFQFCTDD